MSSLGVNRLHYMLQHNLGCPKTFEYRRQEFAIHPSKSKIDDDAIVEIGISDGPLDQYEYLKSVNVAVIGNTLFCRGATKDYKVEA